MRITRVRPGRLLAILVGAAAIVAVLTPPPAGASSSQISLFEDDLQMATNPAVTLQELRHLGVTMVRFNVRWSSIAPSPNSRKRPSFNASDSNAYPSGAWNLYDEMVRD